MKTFTLAELSTYITRVIALNFADPIWVRAEILQVKINRGHYYLELVQKKGESQDISTQAQAVLWSKKRAKILHNLQISDLDEYLQSGSEVSLLVEVQYHSVYGLKLSVQDIDPSYTLGKLELIRQQTMTRVKEENLLSLNGQFTLPPVLQRIAVVSSAHASGYQDFIQHLQNNKQGLRFEYKLFTSVLQGPKVPLEIAAALGEIAQEKDLYDCVVIIRGGGSRLDLSSFDYYDVAEAIAHAPLPVFTGIGHETDTTVADMVSHRSFKTPTAVAGFILDRNLSFEQSLIDLHARLAGALQRSLVEHQRKLDASHQSIQYACQNTLQNATSLLEQTNWKLDQQIHIRLNTEAAFLNQLSEKLNLLRPDTIFNRGYSLTLCNGSIIRDVGILSTGDEISTRYANGSSQSTITQTKLHE